MGRFATALLWTSVSLALTAPALAADVVDTRRLDRAIVRAVAGDQSTLALKHGTAVVTVTAGKEFKKRLEDLRPGDTVTAEVTDRPDAVLKDLSAAAIVDASPRRRVLALLGGVAVVLGVGFIALGTGVNRLLLGKDGRYSNSKLQMAIWFAVLIVTYVAVVGLRAWECGLAWVGGVNLPQNLLLLSGMSALTFAAAKGITMHNIDKAKTEARSEAQAKNLVVDDAVREAERSVKPEAGAAGTSDRALLANLVSDDKGDPDIGDFQMIVVTLLAVGVYVAQIFAFLGSMEKLQIVTVPDVDTTVLAAFGLGQAAYLTKKYAGRNGA